MNQVCFELLVTNVSLLLWFIFVKKFFAEKRLSRFVVGKTFFVLGKISWVIKIELQSFSSLFFFSETNVKKSEKSATITSTAASAKMSSIKGEFFI